MVYRQRNKRMQWNRRQIKKHKLQDTKNKRMINPDQKLGKVIGSEPIDMFKMTSKISKHLKEPELTGTKK